MSQKFIDKKGEGMHHLTFNVPDSREKVAELKAQGVRIVDEHDWAPKIPTKPSFRRARRMEF